MATVTVDTMELVDKLKSAGFPPEQAEAAAFAVVVSPAALQSSWVGRELRHALELQRERGGDAYRVVPLSLDGTGLGVLEGYFDDPPIYIPVSPVPAALRPRWTRSSPRSASASPPTRPRPRSRRPSPSKSWCWS